MGESDDESMDVILIKYKGEWVIVSGMTDYIRPDGSYAIEVVKAFWTGFDNGDADMLVNAMAPVVYESSGSTKQEIIDDLQESFDNEADFSVDCIINESRDPDSDEMDNIYEILSEYERLCYGFYADHVTDYIIVNALVTLEVDGTKETNTFNTIVIEIYGEWKILEMEPIS